MADQLGFALPPAPPRPSPKLRERPAQRYDELHPLEYGPCGHHIVNIGRLGCSLCLAGWPKASASDEVTRFP